jgi:hypothetical protein
MMLLKRVTWMLLLLIRIAVRRQVPLAVLAALLLSVMPTLPQVGTLLGTAPAIEASAGTNQSYLAKVRPLQAAIVRRPSPSMSPPASSP